jgi:hypothetical protein
MDLLDTIKPKVSKMEEQKILPRATSSRNMSLISAPVDNLLHANGKGPGRPKLEWTGSRQRQLLRFYFDTDLPMEDIPSVISEPASSDKFCPSSVPHYPPPVLIIN